ncbi:MAG: hypothetical protein JSR54_14290 [Proteobacteria bacterium]|nr:hypothetical protein [Pseudomonadota bacterium]
MRTPVAALAALLLSLAALPALAGGRPIPLVEIIDAPLVWQNNAPGKLEEVQSAVMAGCVTKGWVPTAQGPGHVHAVLTRPDYRAEIDVTFTTTTLSIKYADSQGLDWNPDKRLIHRNFNRWLTLLQQAINVEMVRTKT